MSSRLASDSHICNKGSMGGEERQRINGEALGDTGNKSHTDMVMKAHAWVPSAQSFPMLNSSSLSCFFDGCYAKLGTAEVTLGPAASSVPCQC